MRPMTIPAGGRRKPIKLNLIFSFPRVAKPSVCASWCKERATPGYLNPAIIFWFRPFGQC